MSEGALDKDTERRPRVVGSFVEPDEMTLPLFVAIGRAVVAAAALENALQLEPARLLYVKHAAAGELPSSSLALELFRFDRLSAGQLLGKLQELGVPADLYERIDAAVSRRNDLVHRTFEDAELVRATSRTESLEPIIERSPRARLRRVSSRA
jgi:hypothetical protein